MDISYNKYTSELVYSSQTEPVPDPEVPAPWVRPLDWIPVSSVGNNEINLLVCDGSGIAFIVNTVSGTYSIDWGDGTIETNRASGTTYQHQHSTGGTPCSLGYNTWKIRIFGASDNITRFQIAKNTFTGKTPQQIPLLEVVFGTVNITTYAWTFRSSSADFECVLLKSVTIPSLVACSSTTNMFSFCSTLQKVNFPTSWGAVTVADNMFYSCTTLHSFSLPSSWGNVTSAIGMFYECQSLRSITLPLSWGVLIDNNEMFRGCRALSNLVLPSAWSSLLNISGLFRDCYALQSVTLPASWGNVVSASYFLSGCICLSSINLPSSWSNIQYIDGIFNACKSLTAITLPSSWGNVARLSNTFANCISLRSLTIPSSWGNVNQQDAMFTGCSSLNSMVLPSTWGNLNAGSNIFNGCVNLVSATLPASFGNLNSIQGIFLGCVNLKTVTGLEYLGSLTWNCDFNYFLYETELLTQSISISSLLSRLQIQGSTAANKLRISSIRLTNPNSSFVTGGITISYTSLDKSALELLFGDLPTGLPTKYITITGCTGTDTLVSKSSSGITTGSPIISIANTSGLSEGMEVYGNNITTAKSITFTDAGDLVNRAAHGFPNGMKVSFSSIVTTTGLVINTPYFVVNASADTFQVSDTLGGSAKVLTNNGTGMLLVYPTIVTVNTNTNIIIDIPCSNTQSITLTAGLLKRSIALLKGWSVTN